MLEDGYPAEIAEELGRRGHEVKYGSGASYFGSAKTIEILDNGVLTGAADTRREASAIGREGTSLLRLTPLLPATDKKTRVG